MEVFHCVQCSKVVTGKQHAIACDDCGEWVHRLCDSGISYKDYRRMVRGEIDLPFFCPPCSKDSTQDVAVESRTTQADEHFVDIMAVGRRSGQTPPGAFLDVPSMFQTGTKKRHFESSSISSPDDSLFGESQSAPQTFSSSANPAFVLRKPVVSKFGSSTSNDVSKRPVAVRELYAGSSDDSNSDLEDTFGKIPRRKFTYTIVEKGDQAGRPVLFRSDGYAYTINKKGKSSTTWKCCVRNRNLHCSALVTQRGRTFSPGRRYHHHHNPKFDHLRKVKIAARVCRNYY